MQAMVERSAYDPEGAYGWYFSVERFAEGADIDLERDDETVLIDIYVDHAADGSIGEPFQSLLSTMRLDDTVFGLADVQATYFSSLLFRTTMFAGSFDVDAVSGRLEEIGGAAPERREDGDWTVLATPEGSDGPYDGERFAFSDGAALYLGDDVDGPDGVLAADGDDSPMAIDGIEQIVTELDGAEVYAATLFIPESDEDSPSTTDGVSSGDDEVTSSTEGADEDDDDGDSDDGDSDDGPMAAPWNAGAVATGFVEGESRAYTVLWHASASDAEANSQSITDLMTERAGCTDPVEVETDEQLAIGSCPTADDTRWSTIVSQQLLFGFPSEM